MQLVKGIVPDNGSLIIPPQGNPWEMEGNGAIMTYFLYPRKIIPSVLGEPLHSGDYALIAKGSWVRRGDVDYGWPKVGVRAKNLWKFDIKNNSFTKVEGDYGPTLDNWDWGLIEVSHE